MIYEKVDVKVEGSLDSVALYVYIHDYSKEIAVDKRPMVIVCPGGAYAITSDREAEIVALQFFAMGYHAAVLHYSVVPAVYPAAILELGKSIVKLRSYAEEWHIDRNKIVPLGFSAGGHMVASYCMFWTRGLIANTLQVNEEELKPNGMILGYPVILSKGEKFEKIYKNLLKDKYEELLDKMSLEKQVNESVPKTFIWHTYEDNAVSVQNSILLVHELVKHNISTEFHMFEKGIHGLGLANRLTQAISGNGIEPSCEFWINLAHTWMENL